MIIKLGKGRSDGGQVNLLIQIIQLRISLPGYEN